MLHLGGQHRAAIRSHGERAYPSEACGALLGQARGDEKTVVATVEAGNAFGTVAAFDEFQPSARESQANRFLIPPGAVVRIEREARRLGLAVVGYYHSHPDHPARPSRYDEEHAWPWLSYVICRIAHGKAEELNSFVLRDDRSGFDDEGVD